MLSRIVTSCCYSPERLFPHDFPAFPGCQNFFPSFEDFRRITSVRLAVLDGVIKQDRDTSLRGISEFKRKMQIVAFVNVWLSDAKIPELQMPDFVVTKKRQSILVSSFKQCPCRSFCERGKSGITGWLPAGEGSEHQRRVVF